MRSWEGAIVDRSPELVLAAAQPFLKWYSHAISLTWTCYLLISIIGGQHLTNYTE